MKRTLKKILEKCGWKLKELKVLLSSQLESAEFIKNKLGLKPDDIKSSTTIDARTVAQLEQMLAKVDKKQVEEIIKEQQKIEQKKAITRKKRELKRKEVKKEEVPQLEQKMPLPEMPFIVQIDSTPDTIETQLVKVKKEPPPKEEPKEVPKEEEGEYVVVKPAQQQRSIEMVRKKRMLRKKKPRPQTKDSLTVKEIAPPQKIEVPIPVSVKDFSQITGIRIPFILKKLLDNGIVANINFTLDEDMVILLGVEFDKDIILKRQKTIDDEIRLLEETREDIFNLVPRPPVVTVMGHVDHGKTTLLDKIRNTNVAQHEPGNITQHIGAYRVNAKERSITFIDTPGHEAFTKMRARGANVTDIVVLVVAANEGVMPQTEEAINHARAAKVPIIVAINKCDIAGVNPSQIKQELAGKGLIPEDWGGDTIYTEISALTGENIPSLIEAILLLSDVHDFKADPKALACGFAIEAKKSEERGPVATFIVRTGTLRKGDFVVCGKAYGKIKAMFDENRRALSLADPSTPVEVLGLSDIPEAGEKFYVVESLEKARTIANAFAQRQKQEQLAQKRVLVKLDKETKETAFIIKADVKGSAEVIRDVIISLEREEIKIKILHCAVGEITETDVDLAIASRAVIIGFGVGIDERAEHIASQSGIKLLFHNIIYKLIDDVKALLEGTLEPEQVKVILGHCEVRKIFPLKAHVICGCYVLDGKITRSSMVSVKRDGKVIYEAEVESLRRFKDDVKEVAQNLECGVRIKGFDDPKEGDILEVYTIQLVPKKIY